MSSTGVPMHHGSLSRHRRAMATLAASIVLFLGISAVAHAAGGTFTAGPNLAGAGRTNAVAVSLANGDVLLIGGTGAGPAGQTSIVLFGSTERYRATGGGSFISGGNERVPRIDHAAVRLNDGRVLVTGGRNSQGVSLASVSIYDPATSTWSAARDMTIDRYVHTATLLADGRVLIVGGGTGATSFSSVGEVTATAEIFDPSTGTFQATGKMTVASGSHTATLLTNGRVLISQRTAHLFDPATGTFTRVGDPAEFRSHGEAVLLPNGRVLIVGGAQYDPANNALIRVSRTAEIFDPVSASFSTTGSMAEPRTQHAVTMLPNGQVLVTGGFGSYDATSPSSSTAELYDPATRTFSSAGSMSVGRGGHTATALPNGIVLVAGGRNMTTTANDSTRYATTEIFAPAATPAPVPAPAPTSGDARFIGTPIFGASGQALAVFSGGSVTQLEAAAKASGATGIWAQDASGSFRLLVVGGPTFVNEPFRAAFASGFATNTPLTLTR